MKKSLNIIIFVNIVVMIFFGCIIMQRELTSNESTSKKHDDAEFVSRTNKDVKLAELARFGHDDLLFEKTSHKYAVGSVNTAWGYGSGTLIAPNKVLTATHVVSKPDGSKPHNFSIQYYPYGQSSNVINKQSKPVEIKSIKRINGDSELTILTLKKPITQIKPLKLSQKMPHRGDSIKAIGYHDDKKNQNEIKQYTNKGAVAYSRKDIDHKKHNVIFGHIKVISGMSGGPIINNDNEIVGVTSFKYNQKDYGGFISTYKIRKDDQ